MLAGYDFPYVFDEITKGKQKANFLHLRALPLR